MTTQLITGVRPRRNERCHCGSGRKYKQCCLETDEAEDRAARAKAAVAEEPRPSPESPSAPPRPPKPQPDQPWKKTSTRGFFHRVRTPRKVGGG